MSKKASAANPTVAWVRKQLYGPTPFLDQLEKAKPAPKTDCPMSKAVTHKP